MNRIFTQNQSTPHICVDVRAPLNKVLPIVSIDARRLWARFEFVHANISIDDDIRINNIIKTSYVTLNNVINTWCKSYESNYSGGKMRGDRGEHVEQFVKNVINSFRATYGLNIRAVKGTDDKKVLKIPDTKIKKSHQVDVHIYKNDIFVAVIECKSYLDSCYYTRACSDFKLFKKFGYNIKKYIFALEDSLKEDTKLFIDYETGNICDEVFYDGKRVSTKPVYDRKHSKPINMEKLIYFVKTLQRVLCDG